MADLDLTDSKTVTSPNLRYDDHDRDQGAAFAGEVL